MEGTQYWIKLLLFLSNIIVNLSLINYFEDKKQFSFTVVWYFTKLGSTDLDAETHIFKFPK